MIKILQKNKTLILLLVILVIATFFRLWQLESIPPGLYPDEAINANDALSNPWKVFYPDNNGREGLFMNLLLLSFSVFGISIWALKFVPAIIGIFTVLGLYLLTKELFNKWGENKANCIALFSSFFLAVSFWHVNFSRIDFRAILVPFVLVFSFYFLFKGYRTKKLWNFILAGVFFGLGFHTYISFRLAVLILFIVLFTWFLAYLKEKQLKKFFSFSILFLVSIFIIALPIGLYFLDNPQDFVSRATGVSIFSQESMIKAFGESLVKHLAMFNIYGDPNWRHNFAESPQLFLPIGILFLAGFVLTIKKFVLSIKNKDYILFSICCLLFGWFFVLLLPGILTAEGLPHALRVIGVIPVAYIFAGLGAWWVYEKLNKTIQKKKIVNGILIIFLIIVAGFQFNKYFLDWGVRPEVEGAFAKNYVEIANYLNSLPPEVQKYVIVNELGHPLYGITIPGQTIMFIESTKFGRPDSIYIKAEELDKIAPDKQKTAIASLYEGGIFEELKKKFPQGKIKEKKGFRVYEINF